MTFLSNMKYEFQRGIKGEKLVFSIFFSNPQVSPFDEIKWEKRTAEITDDSGKAFFRQTDVEVPDFWSQLATKVVVSKYFYGELGTTKRENSVKQLVHRVCRTIADWGIADGYFDQTNGDIFYNELSWLCLHQYGAFNSPVWFNVGLHQQYHIGNQSAQGNWIWDNESHSVKRAETQYEYPQCSACFIQSVDDNMESIMALATSEAMLFKFGSGTGSDLSPIRSSREKLSGGGKPSGPLSFLKVYDQVANVVKSGGKTRRAAKMNTLYDWHGDIEEFIDVKSIEEKKIRALIREGYSASFSDPNSAYSSALYQNENLSVRVSDEFMNAAINGENWWTKTVTGEPLEKKNAADLLNKIAQGTWFCGDPGIQFDSTIQKWHTCKGSAPIKSSNPCSEYLFLNNSACNLASLNLLKFKEEDSSFNTASFRAAVRIFITAQDIIVDRSSYPTPAIAENSHIFRALGLGFANLGSLIMSYGIPYDSEEARSLAGSIAAIMTGEAYRQSALLAATLKPFPGYENAKFNSSTDPLADNNVDSMTEVMRLHFDSINRIPNSEKFAHIKNEAEEIWKNTLAISKLHGFRNAQTTVLAPTGTISFMMDCDTTGVEPDIALVKYKSLVGGGLLKIVNRTVASALESLEYSKDEIEKIEKHVEKFDTIEDFSNNDGEHRSGLKPEHLPVFDCAFKSLNGKRFIEPLGHLRMMAAVQPFISGAISKTVNMPSDCSAEDIKNTYVQAWKLGIKCVAIYRDGSKASQPLNTSKKTNNQPSDSDLLSRIKTLENQLNTISAQADKPVRHRLPATRAAINHKFEIAGHEGYLSVGLYDDGQPGELFITMSKEGSTIGGLMDCIATLTSIALQYGVPLEDLVAKFSYQRFEPWGFTTNSDIRNATSIIDYIFRWMAFKFIDGYAETHRPKVTQPTLNLPEINDIITKAENRSVPDLPMKVSVVSSTNTPKSLSQSISHFQKDAPLCPNCGHITVRNGACYKCLNCGESLGCS